MVKVVSWNIGKREKPWRELVVWHFGRRWQATPKVSDWPARGPFARPRAAQGVLLAKS